MNISEDIIQKVREQNDIVDVISETVRLKKSGRNYTGLCPFHSEKSPSFSVASDKQIFKCFGCGEAGNVISFVMKARNLTFTDAVKVLAERANIPISFSNDKYNKQNDPREKLYKINVEAARFFFSNLKKSQKGFGYFINRGISETTLRKFGLGFAPEGWNNLMFYLKGKGYTELDMISAGLIIKSEKGNYYDRFRNRVMFPVFDYMGKVIGFGGRVMDDSKPKYLNSPETLVFKKGTNLYGLNFAARDLSDRMLIIVEGYMDCIALHQYGITNVAASLGTALTDNQAKLIKRYADRVIISYDADLAGQNATLRGLEVLRNAGLDVRVLTVPQGKDPDEYIRSNGKEAFSRLINDALPLIDYRIKRAADGLQLSDKEAVAHYIKDVVGILQDLNPVEKDVYIKKVSEETGVKEQAIYDLLNKAIQNNVNEAQNMNIVDNFGQKLYLEPAYLKAERCLLKLMLINNENTQYIIENIDEDLFVMDAHSKIFKLINENEGKSEREVLLAVESKCDTIDSTRELINIRELDLKYEESECKKLIDDYIKEIKKFKLEESKKLIMNKIKQYEAKGMLQESVELAQQLVKIKKEISMLK